MKTKEKKTLIMIAINVLMLFFAHMMQINALLYIALFMMVMIVLISDEKLFIPIMLFYLPWSPILKIMPGTTSFFTIAACLFLLKIIFFRKNHIPIKDVLSVVVLLLITIISKIVFINDFSIDYFLFFGMLFLFIIYSKKYSKVINFEISILFLNFGVISACFASQILMNYNHMLKYIDVYVWEDKDLVRLSGFYGDANFYSAQIVLTIACNFVYLLFNEKNRIIVLLAISILIYCGMLSVSKSFILLLLLVFSFWLMVLLLNKEGLKLKVAVMLGLISIGTLTLFSGILNDTIQMYSTRFEMTSDVNSLTTGRSQIQENYIRFFSDNPEMLFLGQGYTNKYYSDFNNRASHNTIIQTIYQFGIIGSVFFVFWIKQLSKYYKVNKDKSKYKSFTFNLLLIMIIIGFFGAWLALDILYLSDFFYFIMLFLICKRYISIKSLENKF